MGQGGPFQEYAALLWAADLVVSTAIHEFFGVAVVEAIYCGCRPVLPWRLSYPELIPGRRIKKCFTRRVSWWRRWRRR